MDARALRCLLVAAAAAVSLPPPAGAETQPQQCQLPGAGADPLADRAGLLAQYERLPQSCLQELFRACTDASSRRLMDFGSAASCSFGYEALLKRGFGGSFHALMAWWNGERGTAVQ
jgi:hypothetical protein